MAKERACIAIDLKSFYASVECMERGLDPLTTNLVVADESRTDKTICLAVSPSLKAYGIPGRPRLFEVKQALRQVKARTGEEVEFIIARPQMARYMQISTQIYDIYLRYVAPEDMHIYSVDEVFIEATPYLATYKMTPKELTERMIHDVIEETGITATAGIGTNLYLAKIAMDIVAKHMDPDSHGVRIASLDEESFRKTLWNHTPITDFWRIGKGTANTLAKHQIYTMGDLARRSLTEEEYFYQLFGVDAEILIDHAWGIEPTTMYAIKHYKTTDHSLSNGQVLSEPYTIDKAATLVREMTEVLVLDLVEKRLVSDSFTLDIGYDKEAVEAGKYHGDVHVDRYGRYVPKHGHGTAKFDTHTSSTKLITERVMDLYKRIANPDLTVRRLTVAANHCIPESENYQQFNLFQDEKADETEKKMQHTMLELKHRFGKNAIVRGTNLLEESTLMERNSQIGGHRS